jgi:protein-disulfide isomerase
VQGIPVALLGLCWFGAVLLLQVSARVTRVPQEDHVSAYAFVLSIPALAVALYLAYAAFFILKAVCLLCLATDVAIIGIFILSGMITRFSLTTLPGRLARDLRTLAASPLALALLILFVAGAASALAFFPREGVAPDAASLAAGTAPAAPSGDAAQAAAGAQAGAAGAAAGASDLERFLDTAPRAVVPVDVTGAVVIVKFNDYQCPPCRQTYELYKPLKAKWEREAPGKVKWVTKDFALEPECNAGVQNTVHQFACEAAVAVRLSRAKGKGEAMEDWIFANQPSLSLESLKAAVQNVGGVTDFDAKYAATLSQVKGDTALGGILGVNQTPTFYINGVRIPPLEPKFFDEAIAYELKKASK